MKHNEVLPNQASRIYQITSLLTLESCQIKLQIDGLVCGPTVLAASTFKHPCKTILGDLSASKLYSQSKFRLETSELRRFKNAKNSVK